MKDSDLLDWVHSESIVHSGSVGEDAGDGRLEEKSKSQDVIAHTLLEKRVASCFADDQVGPLDDNHRDEEGRVTSVLQLFASLKSL